VKQSVSNVLTVPRSAAAARLQLRQAGCVLQAAVPAFNLTAESQAAPPWCSLPAGSLPRWAAAPMTVAYEQRMRLRRALPEAQVSLGRSTRTQ